MTETKNNRLIHVAFIFVKGIGKVSLFLREVSQQHYVWFKAEKGSEEKTPVNATTIEEAIRLAAFFWKDNSFKTLGCGFRYTLPERDEHGTNALFYQMASSYASMNGIYFDEELGNNCIVHNASLEAREFLKKQML